MTTRPPARRPRAAAPAATAAAAAVAICAALGAPGCALLGYEVRSDGVEDQLEREVLALRLRNAELEQAAQDCAEVGAARMDALHTQLLQVFTGSEVTLARDGALVHLTIPGELLFSGSGEDLREEAAMVFDLLSVALGLHPEVRITVTGHTDDRPLSSSLRRRYGDGWGLSVAQARLFMGALAGYGVAAERFTVAGRGPAEPVADNATPEGRTANRRVVVTLAPPP